MSKRKYYLKRGYFGLGGKIFIPKWEAYLCRWLTDFSIFYERDGKEIWWERKAKCPNYLKK